MMNIFENNYPKDFKKDGFVDNPVDREKRNLSSLKPEDLLPESPEIKRNLQHQSVRSSDIKDIVALPNSANIL
ncbi:hypothetical protein O3M35_002784 [Rhynocoris fuscipes]|uniref:Uncharacterized protein n=1 Tax=Rhynocoris fuscipes TaxID=488301 RepID=A0AAW1CQJ6_9HEMI